MKIQDVICSKILNVDGYIFLSTLLSFIFRLFVNQGHFHIYLKILLPTTYDNLWNSSYPMNSIVNERVI